jgi:hypothetical protein
VGFTHCCLALQIINFRNQFHSCLLSVHGLLGWCLLHIALLGAILLHVLLAHVVLIEVTIHKAVVTIIGFCSRL